MFLDVTTQSKYGFDFMASASAAKTFIIVLPGGKSAFLNDVKTSRGGSIVYNSYMHR